MKIAVIHDYADVFRQTRAYPRLQEHEVIIHTEASTDPALVIAQAAGCDALLLTQQRVPLTRQMIDGTRQRIVCTRCWRSSNGHDPAVRSPTHTSERASSWAPRYTRSFGPGASGYPF